MFLALLVPFPKQLREVDVQGAQVLDHCGWLETKNKSGLRKKRLPEITNAISPITEHRFLVILSEELLLCLG